jgi:hypothetical protein
MRKQVSRAKLIVLALVVAGFATMGFASAASAHSGLYARFNYCPSTTPGVFKCIQSITSGGKVVLGKKTVPIVNPVTLQGGVSEGEEIEEHFYEKFFAASNGGETLSKTPQPVPGGLTGLVNCKEISIGWLRASCEAIFENGLTGVNATLELAKPASEIVISEENLAFEIGVAVKLPVKVHLENPLLGSTCYIGSSSSPLIWNLTTGVTKPPAGTAPINGTSGKLELLEGGLVAQFSNVSLVDNAWSAPGATGCGGFLVEYVLDPIINASVGVPSAAGKNVAALEKTQISVAQAGVVNEH